LRGACDTDISFLGLCSLLKYFDFEERIKGSHHIFTKEGVSEILNIQPKCANAKAYQVKQVRNIILKYKIGNTKNV